MRAMPAIASNNPIGQRTTFQIPTAVPVPNDEVTACPTAMAAKAATTSDPALTERTKARPYFLSVGRSCSIP